MGRGRVQAISDQADTSPLTVFDATTRHVRTTPFRRIFDFRMLVMALDLDRLDEADRLSPLFGVNRPALFEFRGREHGQGDAENPRAWALARLADAGVASDGLGVRLFMIPRSFGYAFKPLSIYVASAANGAPRGVVFEVHNTFGERHAYVGAWSGEGPLKAPKQFHVSPFQDRTGEYRFDLSIAPDRFSARVINRDGASTGHLATWNGRRVRASTATLAMAALRMPFMSLGVTLGIHWHALWIWLRGAGYRNRPAPILPAQTPCEPLRTDTRSHPLQSAHDRIPS